MINLSKKIAILLCIILSFAMILVISSCGGNEPPTNSDTQTDTESSSTDTGSKVTVTFYSNGGTPVESIQVEKNSKIKAPKEPTREGYTFDGWLYGNEKWSFIGYVVTEDMTLVASWILNGTTVVFNANGGEGEMEGLYITSGESKNLTTNTFVKSGYTFKGWSTKRNGEVEYTDGASYKASSSQEDTLYAIWEANENSLILNINDGTDEKQTITLKTDEATTLSAPTTQRKGYTFKGWSIELDGTVKYEVNAEYTMGAESTYTLYAVWEANENTLILDINNGTDEKETITLKTDEKATLPTPSAKKEGYSVVGWSTTKDGEIEYEANAEYTMGAESAYTLYAIWRINVNDLVFDMNDGKGKEVVKLESFASYTIPTNTYTRDGYIFKGWSTTKDGEIEYEEGATYVSGAESQVVFYAVWEIIEYKLTYNNAPELSETEITFTVEDLPLTLPRLNDTNDKMFECWYTSEDLSGEPIIKITTVGDVNLYPSFANATKGLNFVDVNGGLQVSGYTGDSVDVTIPSFYRGKPVISIGRNAFSGSSIISIELPKKLEAIGESAFYECRSLTTIEIPQSVTSIGKYAFRNCTSLLMVELPSELKTIGDAAFLACHKLEYIEIPASVISIGQQAFSYCYCIKSLVIPQGITTLGPYAFEQCYALQSITLPEGLIEIGIEMFYDCSKLVDIKLPSTVKTIGDSAFSGCSSLITLELPNGLKSIGENAFFGCSALEEMTIPEGIAEISKGVFCNCVSLVEIKLPSTILSIKEDGFRNCESIIMLELPITVKSIENRAFYGCDVLEKIVLPEGLTVLGEEVFGFCIKLKDVNIPSSITRLSTRLFNRCDSLEYIILPSNLKSIEDEAFNFCVSLKSISVPESVTTLGDDVFYGCESLASITLSKNLKYIGANAFYGCESLSTINIPKTVVSVGANAFKDCSMYLAINCEAERQPTAWSSTWNPSGCQVFWGQEIDWE